MDQALQAWEKAAENAAGRRATAQIVKSAVRQLNLNTTAETAGKQSSTKALGDKLSPKMSAGDTRSTR